MEPRQFLYETSVGPRDPVVLIPGGLSGWNSWVPFVEPLSEDRTVVRVQPTQNELGGMEGKVGDTTYTAEVELGGLLLALDDLRLERAHVAGWSNGAKLALHLALAHPGRVRSLTLIEPAAPWVLESAGEPVADFGKDEAHRRAGRQVTDDDLASFLVSAGVVPAEWDRAAIEAAPVWAGSFPLRNALSWTFPATWGNHHVDELASIDCATLVVRGSDTAPSRKAIAALVADRIPHAELLELPGGHACHLENAEAFVTTLRRHLDDADVATTA